MAAGGAADLHPLVGSRDVASPPDAACGALSRRCGYSKRLDAEALAAGCRVGMLEPETLRRARRKHSEIEAGTITGSFRERATDGDLEYRDWLEEGPAQVLAA